MHKKTNEFISSVLLHLVFHLPKELFLLWDDICYYICFALRCCFFLGASLDAASFDVQDTFPYGDYKVFLFFFFFSNASIYTFPDAYLRHGCSGIRLSKVAQTPFSLYFPIIPPVCSKSAPGYPPI